MDDKAKKLYKQITEGKLSDANKTLESMIEAGSIERIKTVLKTQEVK